ncbi:MAG: LacI family DNA-binding transcriptional regulator [Luteolibacter sp.]
MEPDYTPRRRVSLRDIAREVGVSHCSVSLALRDSSRISKILREKIQKVAKEMGYEPDPMLMALSHYRQGKKAAPIRAGLAWINAWQPARKLRSFREFDLYWQGASQAALKYGYRLEEFCLDAECRPKRLHQILSARGIRGILLPPQHPHPDWQDFPWEHYSVVRFGRSLKAPECHVVTADQAVNTMLAFEKIQEHGYERIGFVDCRDTTVKIGHMFQAGFLLSQMDLDVSKRVPVLDINSLPNSGRYKQVAQWVRKHQVDAILTGHADVPGILKKAGIRVPEDVGLVGTSILDIPIAAGIDQHSEEIGRVGLLMLNSLINDGARGTPPIFRQILVEGSWVDGDTLPDRSLS